MTTFRFGKAKVSVDAKGCVDCGTEHSSGWHDARRVIIHCGTRCDEVMVHRCADCEAKMKRKAVEA